MNSLHFKVTASVALAIDVARFLLSKITEDDKVRFVHYSFSDSGEDSEDYDSRNIVVDGIATNGMRYNINVFLKKVVDGKWVALYADVTPILPEQAWGKTKTYSLPQRVQSNGAPMELPEELFG